LSKIHKCYRVLLEKTVTDIYIDAFAKGMYFSYENIITQSVQLSILSPYQTEVILTEGKYHQIKRMFGRFRNKVIGLHRTSIGGLELDGKLSSGQSRHLTENELKKIKPHLSD
jgi:16S rRNA pseudouridine516 synthase